jgi:hypothetical protein
LEEDLTPTLESNMTAPSLKKALLLILQKWREGKTIKPSNHPQIFGIREAGAPGLRVLKPEKKKLTEINGILKKIPARPII